MFFLNFNITFYLRSMEYLLPYAKMPKRNVDCSVHLFKATAKSTSSKFIGISYQTHQKNFSTNL